MLDTQRGRCKKLHVALGGLLLGPALTSGAVFPAAYLKVIFSETFKWREKYLPLFLNMTPSCPSSFTALKTDFVLLDKLIINLSLVAALKFKAVSQSFQKRNCA